MAKSFALRVLTPTGAVFEGDAEEVTAQGPLGQFGVLAEHINLVTSLVPGIFAIKLASGSLLRYVVLGGLVEIRDGAMTVLADGSEKPGSLGRAQIDAQLAAAEAKLAGMNSYAPEYEDARRDLMLARARQAASESVGPTR